MLNMEHFNTKVHMLSTLFTVAESIINLGWLHFLYENWFQISTLIGEVYKCTYEMYKYMWTYLQCF